MCEYLVLLGIDRAARDTKRRMKIRVLAENELSAAIQAEQLADKTLDDPKIEYTHAMTVRAINKPMPAAMAMAA